MGYNVTQKNPKDLPLVTSPLSPGACAWLFICMAKPAAKKPLGKKLAGSHQISIRVPGPLWEECRSAMAYEGVRTFAQYAVSGLTRHVRASKERRQSEDAFSASRVPQSATTDVTRPKRS